jgi:hypothetical protein
MLLAVSSIRTDGGTQPRDHVNESVVERYAEAMAAGLWDFTRSASPIVVFFDGTDYWLGDGFHRIAAAKTATLAEVEAEVRQGTLRDAKWFSFGVNAEHGYARSKEDVARILKAIFADAEWRTIPLREIARHTRIPKSTVADYHERHCTSVRPGQIAKPAARTVTRGGTSYTMDTGAIGKAKAPPPANGKVRDAALMTEARETGQVIVDFTTGKRYDPMSPDERAENERRKMLSMELIELLEFLANNEVTPERAAREFFGPVAHCISPPLLRSAIDWLTTFEKEWQQCEASPNSATGSSSKQSPADQSSATTSPPR